MPTRKIRIKNTKRKTRGGTFSKLNNTMSSTKPPQESVPPQGQDPVSPQAPHREPASKEYNHEQSIVNEIIGDKTSIKKELISSNINVINQKFLLLKQTVRNSPLYDEKLIDLFITMNNIDIDIVVRDQKFYNDRLLKMFKEINFYVSQ